MLIFPDRMYKHVYAHNEIGLETWSGDVLCLGLGTAYIGRNMPDTVDRLLYIEIDEEIIEKYGKGFECLHGDAYDIEIDDKFDVIFVNIWYYPVNESEVMSLVDKWCDNLKVGGTIIYLNTIIKLNNGQKVK